MEQQELTKKAVRTVIVLTAGYLFCQVVADITAVKVVEIFGAHIPAGVFIYGVTFTWRDLIHRRLGKAAAVTMVWVAAAVNVLMVLYFIATITLPPSSFWHYQDAYRVILGLTPRIAIASIIAEIVSELVDTEVYHYLRRRPALAVLGSNAVSLIVDSAVFVTLAFGGLIPTAGIVMLAKGQTVAKAVITVLSLPLIYVVRQVDSG